MVWRLLSYCLLGIVVLLGDMMVSAHAQESDIFGQVDLVINRDAAPDVSFKPVESRALPEYQPLGIRLGKLALSPSIDTRTIYDSNVFAQENNQESDFIMEIQPRLRGLYEFGRHRAAFNLSSMMRRFDEFDTEDKEDHFARFILDLQPRSDIELTATLNYIDRKEDRSAVRDADLTVAPIDTETLELGVGFHYHPNQFGYRLALLSRRLRFENAITGDNTRDVIRSDDNRDITTLTGEVDYDLYGTVGGYVRGTIFEEDFRNPDRDNLGNIGIARDSNGYRGLVGIALSDDGLLVGSIGAGYEKRSFKNEGIDDVENLIFQGDLQWAMTPLTSVLLTADQRFDGSNQAVAGTLETKFGARLTHELRRDTLVFLQGEYEIDEFDIVNREDTSMRFLMGIGKAWNRHADFSARYRYEERDSTQAGSSFDRHIATLGLNIRY